MTPILVATSGGVAEITINRPDRRNALDLPALTALENAVSAAADDDAVSVLLLTGAGDDAFCAGADTRLLTESSPEQVEEYGLQLLRLTYTVARLPKATVGALAGHAVGAGARLASALDLRIGAPNTRLRFPGVEIGRVAAVPGLVHTIGLARAKELAFTGRAVEADEAYRWGLLNQVVPLRELRPAARELARRIAAGSTSALRLTKRLLDDASATPPSDAMDRELAAARELLRSDDAAHRAAARFVPRRKEHLDGRAG